jgi:hypothetical protein
MSQRSDQLKSIILLNIHILDHSRRVLNRLLLGRTLLLLHTQNRSLALCIKNLIFALYNLLRLLHHPLLLSHLDQAVQSDGSSLDTWACTSVVVGIEDSRFLVADCGLDGRRGVILVLREEFEEGFGEWGGGMVVGVNKSIDLSDHAVGCGVVVDSVLITCRRLGGFIGVGFVRWVAINIVSSLVWISGEEANIRPWLLWADLLLLSLVARVFHVLRAKNPGVFNAVVFHALDFNAHAG